MDGLQDITVFTADLNDHSTTQDRSAAVGIGIMPATTAYQQDSYHAKPQVSAFAEHVQNTNMYDNAQQIKHDIIGVQDVRATYKQPDTQYKQNIANMSQVMDNVVQQPSGVSGGGGVYTWDVDVLRQATGDLIRASERITQSSVELKNLCNRVGDNWQGAASLVFLQEMLVDVSRFEIMTQNVALLANVLTRASDQYSLCEQNVARSINNVTAALDTFGK